MNTHAPPSSFRLSSSLLRSFVLLLVLGSLLLWNARHHLWTVKQPAQPTTKTASPPPHSTPPPPASAPAPAAPMPAQPPAVPPVPESFVDEDQVRQAKAHLAAQRAELTRASELTASLESDLKQAQHQLAALTLQHKALDRRLKDPRAALQAVHSRIQSEQSAIATLQGEFQALAEAPGPRRRPFIDRSPVARPPNGDEFHFEIQNDRIAFIDLERLLDRVKSDAMVQLRLAERAPVVRGEVGPVGDFAIRYQIARGGLDDLLSSSVTVTLTGWEIVPIRDPRGETFDQAMDIASDLSRVIARMNPDRDAITIWVYPDGFPLFRRIRDALSARGILVAARPLPQTVPIRGSPVGSISAVQ